MVAKEWVMVRLTVDAHAALVELRRRLVGARDGCHPSLQEMDPDISLSGMVLRLVRHHHNDQRRKRESRRRISARRRAARQAGSAGA